MHYMKICPNCLYLSNSKYDADDISICPFCQTKLDETGIPESQRTAKAIKIIEKYRKKGLYDKEAAANTTSLRAARAKAAEQAANAPTLTTCPVCQGKVSSAAAACPHCGQPMAQTNPVLTREVNVPKCPTCGSKRIRKIGYFDRATSVAFWGLGSGKLGKSMICEDCKYKW